MKRLAGMFTMLAIGLLLFAVLAQAEFRFADFHIKDARDNSVTVVGVLKFKDAMPDQEYTATMTMKENGVEIATRTLTLLESA